VHQDHVLPACLAACAATQTKRYGSMLVPQRFAGIDPDQCLRSRALNALSSLGMGGFEGAFPRSTAQDCALFL
jgi:hypothetical protein